MSEFVRKPLLQQLNKENPITRIEVLESKESVRTSAIINNISELSSNMGEMISGQFNFYNPNTGQLVGYLSSVPLPGYPSYYFVMTDAAGNVQFSVDPSTSGGTTMGNGNVAIAENGVTIANGISSYILKDASGSAANIYLNSTTDNILEIRNQASAGVVKQIIIMTDGTKPSLRFLQDVGNVNAAQLTLDVATNGSQIGIGGEVIIWGGKDGKETVFNEGSYDIDFRVEGATNTNLLKLDAGLDAIGIGKVASSDYLVDIDGDVNLLTGHALKINGTTVISGTKTGVTNGDTHNHVGGDGAVLYCYQAMPAHGLSGTIAASTTVNANLFYYGLSATLYNFTIPRGGTLKNLRWNTNTAQPGTGSLVATVYVNNAASTLTATIAAGGAAQTATDTTHTVAVNAADALTIKVQNNATGASAQVGGLSFELEIPTA